MAREGTIKVRNARIMFKNFEGRPDKYHKEGGKRQFTLVIEDEEMANQLKDDGWSVSFRNVGDDENPVMEGRLKVNVSFAYGDPNVYMIIGKKKKKLNQQTIGNLDTAEISNVDVNIYPSYAGKKYGFDGPAAYVEKMIVTVVEDDLDIKYGDMDDDDDEVVPFD